MSPSNRLPPPDTVASPQRLLGHGLSFGTAGHLACEPIKGPSQPQISYSKDRNDVTRADITNDARDAQTSDSGTD